MFYTVIMLIDLIGYALTGEAVYLLTAGLFAVAASISDASGK